MSCTAINIKISLSLKSDVYGLATTKGHKTVSLLINNFLCVLHMEICASHESCGEALGMIKHRGVLFTKNAFLFLKELFWFVSLDLSPIALFWKSIFITLSSSDLVEKFVVIAAHHYTFNYLFLPCFIDRKCCIIEKYILVFVCPVFCLTTSN